MRINRYYVEELYKITRKWLRLDSDIHNMMFKECDKLSINFSTKDSPTSVEIDLPESLYDDAIKLAEKKMQALNVELKSTLKKLSEEQ